MRINSKKIKILVLIVVVIVFGFLALRPLISTWLYGPQVNPVDFLPVEQSVNENLRKKIEPSYVADFSDDTILMGASHNVFVGKVIQEAGTKDASSGIPATQFEVEIVDNIKGNLDSVIVVNQEGGFRDGVLYIISDDLVSPNDNNYLLEVGKTYLLATRYNSRENWHTLNSHPNARKTISENPNISKSQLESIARNDPKVQALQEAYKNEILLDADIKHNNTLNSYKSLHPEGDESEVKE